LKKMSKTRRRVKFFEMIARLSIYAQAKGYLLLPICFKRTRAKQLLWLAQGKSKVRHSFHQDWLAIDFVILRGEVLIWRRSMEYEDLGLAWEKMGGVWGGRWKRLNDIYHFQEGDWHKVLAL